MLSGFSIRHVLANVCVTGGENVARGSVLGTLLGTAHGADALSSWLKDGLLDKDEIDAEICALLDSTGGHPQM
eukprot:m.503416 g.503416  ORF g.503416 m.503416 type:complete len:73 (+) comp21847_c0_seq6:216-434(+)